MRACRYGLLFVMGLFLVFALRFRCFAQSDSEAKPDVRYVGNLSLNPLQLNSLKNPCAMTDTLFPIPAPIIIAQDGTYLGRYSNSSVDPDSICNPVGKYGSRISPLSINNRIGQYGSPISPLSAFNSISMQSPKVYSSSFVNPLWYSTAPSIPSPGIASSKLPMALPPPVLEPPSPPPATNVIDSFIKGYTAGAQRRREKEAAEEERELRKLELEYLRLSMARRDAEIQQRIKQANLQAQQEKFQAEEDNFRYFTVQHPDWHKYQGKMQEIASAIPAPEFLSSDYYEKIYNSAKSRADAETRLVEESAIEIPIPFPFNPDALNRLLEFDLSLSAPAAQAWRKFKEGHTDWEEYKDRMLYKIYNESPQSRDITSADYWDKIYSAVKDESSNQ
jgi:hypothetical protein